MLPTFFPMSFFIFYLFLAFLTAYIAIRRNRNPFIWFIAGLFLGVLGIIFLLILPNKNSDPSNDDSNDDGPNSSNTILTNLAGNIWNKPKTLSEEDTYQEHNEEFSPPQKDTPPPSPEIQKDSWYYLDSAKKNAGPYKLEELVSNLKKLDDPQTVWIWKKGMPDWKRAKDIPEILCLLTK